MAISLLSVHLFSINTGTLAQVQSQDEGIPFMDYWPVILLPIFVIVLYRVWKVRRK
ncbi:hypothetical protein [Cyclobacterium lianum]|uniref:hypothetical protein n=1 Tax=Cyclobacterium lianum TaxID=388280 RepID=UPI0015B40404|nr:hypothetical protein [Cyclobacterium lianum]